MNKRRERLTAVTDAVDYDVRFVVDLLAFSFVSVHNYFRMNGTIHQLEIQVYSQRRGNDNARLSSEAWTANNPHLFLTIQSAEATGNSHRDTILLWKSEVISKNSAPFGSFAELVRWRRKL